MQAHHQNEHNTTFENSKVRLKFRSKTILIFQPLQFLCFTTYLQINCFLLLASSETSQQTNIPPAFTDRANMEAVTLPVKLSILPGSKRNLLEDKIIFFAEQVIKNEETASSGLLL